MYLRCNPDVHFVFPDFPFMLHLSTSGFPNARKCNLNIFAQMYGDVCIRQMYANVLQMYIQVKPPVTNTGAQYMRIRCGVAAPLLFT